MMELLECASENPGNVQTKYMLILQSLKYQIIVFTDRIKQSSQFDVSLLYSYGVSFVEVQEGLNTMFLGFW